MSDHATGGKWQEAQARVLLEEFRVATENAANSMEEAEKWFAGLPLAERDRVGRMMNDPAVVDCHLQTPRVDTARESFGARLRSLRERAGLSEKQLADTIGANQAYVSLLERNEAAPETVVIIERLAAALGLSTVELLTGRPATQPRRTIRLTANNFAGHLSTTYAASLVEGFTVPVEGIDLYDWIVVKLRAWIEVENARSRDAHFEMSRHAAATLLERLAGQC